MKRLACFCLCSFLIVALSAMIYAQQRPAPGQRETLTNEAIINLSKAHFKESTIISLIRTSPVAFDISTAKLIELKKRGVSEHIVMAMIERQSYTSNAQSLAMLGDDDFFSKDNEAFFNSDPTRTLPSANKRP